MFICLFTKLQRQKKTFVFRNSAVKPQHVLFENEPFFCAKCQYRFLALIFLYTLKNIRWKNYVRFCKIMEIELRTYTFLFFRKSNLKFCIIFKMISFVNVHCSVRIRSACSKAMLLTVSSSNIVAHSNGYIKGDKYFFFKKK